MSDVSKVPSAIDQRRLRDGAIALTVSTHVPETLDEIRQQINNIRDGIAALQSLDALGTEANACAYRDEQELWRRMKALEQRLKGVSSDQEQDVLATSGVGDTATTRATL